MQWQNRRVVKAAVESEQKAINLGGDSCSQAYKSSKFIPNIRQRALCSSVTSEEYPTSACHIIKPQQNPPKQKKRKCLMFLSPDGDASQSAPSHWFARPSTGSSSGSTLSTSLDLFVLRISFSVSRSVSILEVTWTEVW